MLRNTKDLEDCAIGATDGAIGDIRDFYFDDEAWVIRYFVVDTGSWLSSRKVLISPIAMGKPDWAARTLPVAITKAQVKDSPDIDTEQPVSRQQETEVLGYYGHPYYWAGGLNAHAMLPGYAGMGSAADARPEEARHRHDDPHLRSCDEVIGYHIHATDGDIGHVQGFLVDEETWAVRYLIVNTSNWWHGHEVLIAPQWIQSVNWSDKSVSVDMTRQAVQETPPYDSALPLDRQQEIDIHKHHGRTGYWPDGAKHGSVSSRH